MRRMHFYSVLGALLLFGAIAPMMKSQIETVPAVTQGHALKNTIVEMNNVVSTASCSSSNCMATEALFPTSTVVCPASAGQACTLYIAVEAIVGISSQDGGFYDFVVDGNVTAPGPVSWQPSGGSASTPYAITSQVTNTSLNQTHTVVVNLGCQDMNGDGCSAIRDWSTLRIDVLKP